MKIQENTEWCKKNFGFIPDDKLGELQAGVFQ